MQGTPPNNGTGLLILGQRYAGVGGDIILQGEARLACQCVLVSADDSPCLHVLARGFDHVVCLAVGFCVHQSEARPQRLHGQDLLRDLHADLGQAAWGWEW